MQADERYIFTVPYLLQFLLYRDNCFPNFRFIKRISRPDGLEKDESNPLNTENFRKNLVKNRYLLPIVIF